MTTNTEKMNVLSLYVSRGLLLVSGLLAAGIAAMILFAPDAFYSGYGIDVGSNVNLTNEMKAPAGMLLLAGLLMLIGVLRAELAALSLATATVIYLSYGLSRLLSMAIDGVPNSALVLAAVLEVGIGLACLFGLLLHRRATSD